MVTRYIIHDAVAKEVNQEKFYHTRESGGTVISSAYNYCNKIIEEEYDQEQWNIYVFHFSDGDNWSGGDTDRCVNVAGRAAAAKGEPLWLRPGGKHIRQRSVHSGTGEKFRYGENLVTSRIENKDDIYRVDQGLSGKGK